MTSQAVLDHLDVSSCYENEANDLQSYGHYASMALIQVSCLVENEVLGYNGGILNT